MVPSLQRLVTHAAFVVSLTCGLIPAAGADKNLLAIAPALAGKKALNEVPTAYVCEFGICQAPTSDPLQVREQILVGWRK